jgi:hypothetical protein
MSIYKLKKFVVGTSLLALGTAFEIVSKRGRNLRSEISDWEEGRVFLMGVMQDGPAMVLKKEGGRILYQGSRSTEAEPKILFKNIDCAFMPLTGMMSADTAFVQRRAVLHGSVGAAMEVSRAVAIVQSYLLPGFTFRWLYKRPPRLSPGQYLLKAWVFAALLPCMAANLAKTTGRGQTA